MLASLMPGLRSLRAAFLTGALLLGSLYVLFGAEWTKDVRVRAPARTIIELSPYVPIGLLALACLLVGSLYMTSLEGLVDFVHRRCLLVDQAKKRTRVARRVLRAVAPLSVSARARITVEAKHFFDEHSKATWVDNEAAVVAREAFACQVLADLLWLEGKLAGSSLESPYDQYRSEGELRLGTALVLPLVAGATGYALHVRGWYLVLLVGVTVLVALKLADYGLYYFKRAHSFVAHHVSDGTILTPSMETLRRTGYLGSDRSGNLD